LFRFDAQNNGFDGDLVVETMTKDFMDKGERNADAKHRVRLEFATPAQRDEYLDFSRRRARNYRHNDLVTRAEGQVSNAFSHLRVEEEDRDDLLLWLISIRSQERCSYCGDTPADDDTVDLTGDRKYSQKTYMQLYEEREVVPACVFCNWAKSDWLPEEFLQWARNVVNYQDHKIPATIPIRLRAQRCNWSQFKHSARQCGHPVTITKEQFTAMTNDPCFHCGFAGDPNGGGIDRLLNNPIYSPDESAGSCWPCNSSKGHFTSEYMYQKCRKIVARPYLK
jgi:hypothetical protein